MCAEPLTEAPAARQVRRTKRYPGTIERRGNSLRVILYAGGKRHAFTLATLDRREAVDFAKAKASELERGVARERVGLPRSLPVSALLDKFEAERLPVLSLGTQETYGICLATFRAFFVDQLGNPKVSEIRSGHVQEYLTWRRAHPLGGKRTKVTAVSARTVARDRACLHAVFALAETLELRDGNPVAKTKAPRFDPRSPVILSETAYEKLLKACADRPMLQLYVTALGESGARCESEVLHWQWDDLDFEGGFVRIATGRDGHRTKSGKERWVPMTPTLKQALRAHAARYRFAVYRAGERTPWVFHHERAGGRATAGQRIGTLRRAFQKAVERAGLPAALHQHDLRHRRVTTWLAQGKDVVLVKEAVGHADLRTTMGYTHLAKEHLRALVEPVGSRGLQKVGEGA